MGPFHQASHKDSWSAALAPMIVIVTGAVLPVVGAMTGRSGLEAFADEIGTVILAAGLTLLVIRTGRVMQGETRFLRADVQGLAVRLDRCSSQIDGVRDTLAVLEKTVVGEQRNLGMVAGGLGDMRQIVGLERSNLGLVADGVDEIRDVLRTIEGALEESNAAAVDASSRLDDVATRASSALVAHDELRQEVLAEQRNLGMVAGALDDLRRLTAGVHLFDVRQAAFEDTLIQIADRVDQIGTDRLPSTASDGSTIAQEERFASTTHRVQGRT